MEVTDQEGETSATHISALQAIGPQATTEAQLVVARLEVEAAQHLRAAQEEDPPDLKMVRQWLADGRPLDKLTTKRLSRVGRVYVGMCGNHSLHEQGVIRLSLDRTGLTGKRSVPCLSYFEWDEAIRVTHIQGGHMGREVTLSRLVARVFFPCKKGEVAGYIEACRTCQTKHGKGADQRHTLRSVPAGYPFQRIHIDLVGPLNKGAQTGASNILTVCDAFTKLVEAIPLTATTTLEVARALEREIFSHYGYPETVHSDCGPQFTSRFFLDLGKTLGIQITNTTGYNPKGNGQVEGMHRDLAALSDNPKASWEDVLPQALFALRTAICRSTGLAPYQPLFGHDCSTPIDLLFGRPGDDKIDKGGWQHHDYLGRLRKRIDAAQTYGRRNMAEAVVRQRRQYHQEWKSFRPGVKVWLLTPSVKPGTARKLANPWSGRWVVCADGVNNVMVSFGPYPDWSNNQATRVVSIDRLKPYGNEATV